ncbi:MAG: glycosyltransferase, partial [Chloroflexota bacterium]|nr:glycosyltransferase [Chloroflexota bacterium]
MSIVIVTRNRLSSLLRTLAPLSPASSAHSVIVVDNGSTDGTADVVPTAFPDVELLRSDRNLGATGRTLGVLHASTPYVAFSDDDSWWAPGALDRAVEAFEAFPRLALAAARVEVGAKRAVDPTSVAMASSPIPSQPDLPGPPVLGFLACAAVVRRSAYIDVGG